MTLKLQHIDIFSGIGGFAYAIDQVWSDVEHIFCEIDPFCRQVIKKHWKGNKIYGDIREFIADTESGKSRQQTEQEGWKNIGGTDCLTSDTDKRGQTEQELKTAGDKQCDRPFILTGGFPCQPFSCAGKRKGTSDDRHLWPKMFRVIQLTKPKWVIAENVRGLINIQDGVVFEQVCTDLESEGYEVQPFIIPAVVVNAPHRRDRVWIVAHRKSITGEWSESKRNSRRKSETEIRNGDSNAPDTGSNGYTQRHKETRGTECGSKQRGMLEFKREDWELNWRDVATSTCDVRVDDGLPVELDGFELTKAKHRVERLKALGNSIVPQVVIELLQAIKLCSLPC